MRTCKIRYLRVLFVCLFFLLKCYRSFLLMRDVQPLTLFFPPDPNIDSGEALEKQREQPVGSDPGFQDNPPHRARTQ